MKIRQLLLAAMTATLSLSASAKTVDEIRIYINPGHGSYTGTDRPMATMGHGEAGADTAGFYESNTNLWKSFGLLEKLIEYGVPFDRSKNQNNSNPARRGAALDLSQNIVMSHVACGGVATVTNQNTGEIIVRGEYDRPLSEIATEVQTNGFDVFISIHSNANTGTGDNKTGHTNFNQLLFLHRGWDGDPYVAGSYDMCMACWKHAISNKHMHWNWLSNPTVVYNDGVVYGGRKYYPENQKDADGNPYWIKGDVKFQYNTDRGNSSYTRYYGVLNHTIPGFLVEGYDHTYRPAMHRAMNPDVCRHEGELYARGLNDYLGWGKKDSYGKIYGIVRDQSVTMNHPYYSIIQNPTLDDNKYIDQVDNKEPLRNVKVTLYDANGVEKQTYTTDGEWNGAYMFKNVAPGTYTIKHSLSGYNEVTKTVTVTANETNYVDIDMRKSNMARAVRGNYAYDLKLTQTDDKTYTASFKSTGAMINGKIILTNTSNKEQVVIIETGAINDGANSVEINATTLGDGVTYSWAVAFDNPQSDACEMIHSEKTVLQPGGRLALAIDNDEASSRFGSIYTYGTMGGGLQRINPDFSLNGGKVLTNQFGLGSIDYRARIATSEGKVYIADYSYPNWGLWVYTPGNASPTRMLDYYYEQDVAFVGKGDNRVMYTYHKTDGLSTRIQGYVIGKSDSWAGNSNNPSGSYLSSKLIADGSIIATEKGIIASQHRYKGNNTSSYPAFMAFNANVNKSAKTISFSETYSSSTISGSLNGSQKGGMAITRDLSTFAIVDGYPDGSPADISVQVYSVSWSGNTPSFSHLYSIPLYGTQQVDQMEFDHADNLYIASQQQGLLVYAIKNPSRQTVTNGSGTIVGVKPPVNLYVVGNSDAIGNWDTEKAVQLSNDGNSYTVTLDETVTEFKISTNKGDEATFNNGNLAVSDEITNGGTVNLVANKDGGNIILPWTGVWTITVAGDLSTLTATTTTPKPLNPLYIVGNSDAIGAWNTENAVEISNDRINYSITLDETVTEFKISTNKGDEATFNNGNLAVSSAITNGGKVNLIADTDGGNIVLPWAGVWNITIAGDLSTLTATTSTPRPLTPLYLVGNSETVGNWDPYKAAEFSNDGKNYTITLDETVTAFKISNVKSEISNDWSEFDKGIHSADATITNGGTVTLTHKNGDNIVLPWAGEWVITVAGDLSTLTASTSTPNVYDGPGIGAEPENAPNPDALPGEEPEDAQTEGYFAYDLEKPTLSGNYYIFKFKSTGARKNGYIVLKNKSTNATTEIKTPIVKGQNTITVNAYDIQQGNYNTWAVKINNSANNTVEQIGNGDNSIVYTHKESNVNYPARIGLAIDKDETSVNFGKIYTMTGFGQGLQSFNPDLTTNGSRELKNMFGIDHSGSSTNRFYRSNRLEVNGGKVYIANYANSTYKGVWVYDPSASSASASSVESNPQFERAVAFYGSGSSRKVFVYNDANFRRYDIGTASTWNQTGFAKSYYGIWENNDWSKSVLANGDGDVIVTDNGIIVSQNRYVGANDATIPVFVVLDHDLNLKYSGNALNKYLTASQIGGMALGPDKTTFAIVDGWEKNPSNPNVGVPRDIEVDIFKLTWSGTTPTFTYQYSFTLSGTQQVDQMEFDHAGNLLIASREKGLLKYSMKRSAGSVTTNAREEFTINGLGRNTAPTNVVATRKCNGEGANSAAGTVDAEITWNGEAGDYMISYRTMRRDASGNRVYDNGEDWVDVGTATIASGSTTGKFTHKNLAAGSDYNRIYTYKVANYYPAANYESERKYMEIYGKGRTVTSAVATVPVKVTLSQPTEEKNGITLYSFDLKLDLELDKDVFNATLLDDNDELVKATKYVIVVDEATAKALNRATNVKEAGYFYCGPATMTSDNCNHYDINDWYMVVDFDDVTPTGDLSKAKKSITWKNVYPGIAYKPQVYTSAVRTFNFTAADATIPGNPDAKELAMTLPAPAWNLNGDEDENGRIVIGLTQLSGDYSSLISNEDYPMGTFRKVGDTENATNPVTMTKANVIGTAGAMIEPLALTDEVLGYNPETGKYDIGVWRLSYSFDIYKINPETGNWDIVTYFASDHQGNSSDLYSNTQKRFVDIVNFDVACKEEVGPDGRTRLVYDSENAPVYKIASIVNYDYLKNGDGTDLRSFYEKEVVIKPNFEAPQITESSSSAKYIFLEKSTHWDENCDINGGYYKYYYDAAMDLKWNEFDDDLVRNIGFHATPQFNCVGHNVKNEDGTVSDKWVPYYAASVLTDNEVVHYNARATNNYKEGKNIFTNIGYTGTENWTALANQKRHLPVKVHYVWAGNELIPTVKDAAFEFELTADYPIYVDRHYGKPAFFVNSYTGKPYNLAPVQTMARSSEKVEEVFVVSAPTKLNMTMDDIVTVEDVTTGVEDVAFGKGVLMVYPNPAQSEVTIRSTTALGDVKIFTIDGQLVKEFESDDTKAKLNVSDLTSGVYVVSASGTTTRMIKK